MTHTVEPAKSGRSKCRGCKRPIDKGELRFGERLPNPFADDGDMTLWFHLWCGAWRRPASFAEMLDEIDPAPADLEAMRQAVEAGKEHHRLERICGVEPAPSGRARCRSCREPIAKDGWRIALEFFEEGMFNPAGYVHPGCASAYFETIDLIDRLVWFNDNLSDDQIRDLKSKIG
ncbi:MAG: hypothetical protein HUJ31_14720 [Pseudomonadales bacterium]|nr:hypothetical protein [Pseudomonadales bacterium]